MISTNFLPKEPVPPVTSTTCSDQFIQYASWECGHATRSGPRTPAKLRFAGGQECPPHTCPQHPPVSIAERASGIEVWEVALSVAGYPSLAWHIRAAATPAE